MTNYLEDLFLSYHFYAGGTITAGDLVKWDTSHGNGIKQGADGDEEIIGMALDDAVDTDTIGVMLIGVALFKCSAEATQDWGVPLEAAGADTVTKTAAQDLFIGLSLGYAVGAVSTRTHPVFINPSAGTPVAT